MGGRQECLQCMKVCSRQSRRCEPLYSRLLQSNSYDRTLVSKTWTPMTKYAFCGVLKSGDTGSREVDLLPAACN